MDLNKNVRLPSSGTFKLYVFVSVSFNSSVIQYIVVQYINPLKGTRLELEEPNICDHLFTDYLQPGITVSHRVVEAHPTVE